MRERSQYPDAAFRYGSRLDVPDKRKDKIRFVVFWSAWPVLFLVTWIVCLVGGGAS